MFRTKTCGELRAANVGETVTLSGWVDSARDHSGVFFVNIRDRYGKTQTVFNVADGNPELFELVKTLHNEDVVQIEGEVLARPEGLINSDMPTGEIEVKATKLVVLNRSEPVPFLPSAPEVPSEEMRLKYRYIDLRRPEMQRVLTLRHRITKTLRDYFDENGFLEVETPILGKSTPEGARDYLVPSRVTQGSFYALPQSPQLYKQLLMIAGYDRYVQVARCFRDEDLRADRQPEFTQLDVEMSFVDMEDIIDLISKLVARLMKDVKGQVNSSRGGGTDAYQALVRQVLLDIVPQGAALVFAGHSLGGMTAQLLRADPVLKDAYEIVNVLCGGSPLMDPDGETEGTLHRLTDKLDLIPYIRSTSLCAFVRQIRTAHRESGGYFLNPDGAHNLSYARDDVWGSYDVFGQKGGTAAIRFDAAKVQSFGDAA